MTRATLPSRAHRFVLHVAMLLLVFPLFAGLGYAFHAVMGVGMGGPFSSTAPVELKWVLAVVCLLALLAAILILWKGRVRIPLCAVGAAYLVLWFWLAAGLAPPEPPNIELTVGGHSAPAGVEVYCNGVHLGETPLVISKREFRQKVQPWETPPRQEQIEPCPFPGKELSSANLWWVPRDVFEQYEQSPLDLVRYFVRDNDEATKVFRSSRYWWHFRVSGHEGVTHVSGVGSGWQGTSWCLKVPFSPQTTFPSLEPHLDLLVDGLRSDQDRPTPAWIAHFGKHKHGLFLPFYRRVEQDARLRPALDAVVRAEFDLPQTPTPDDCDRVLGIILDRAEARGAFQIPSIESLAIDLLGDAAREPVVRRFRKQSRLRSTGRGSAGSDGWEIHWRTGRTNRQLPLEYAVQRLSPPELFDGLVYRQSRTGGYLELIASYPNEEAVRLMHKYLWDFKYKRGRRPEMDEALRVASRIRNPQVDPLIQNFMRDEGVGPFRRQYVMDYYRSRIGAPDVHQSTLAGWIFHWSALDEQGKLELLARIDSSQTYHYVESLGATRDSVKRRALVQRLAQATNPSLDQFLIDSYDWWRGPKGPGPFDRRLTEALLKTDTAAVRAFIEQRWSDPAERQALLRAAGWAESRLPHLEWMVWLVEPSTDAETRRNATRLLARIGTDAAWTLLENWAEDDSSERVRQAATRQLDLRQKREAEAEKRLQQYADLISGKIGPEDLLPPQPAWVWDGERYVPESEPPLDSRS